MQSLLDVVLANYKEEQIKGAYLCRLVIVCSLKQKQTCTDIMQVLLPQGDDVTGLAVVLPTCVAVLLEGTSQALQKAVNCIQKQQVKPGGDIKAAKVLLNMEGVPERCCQSLFSAFIPSTSSMEEADPADSTQIVQMSSSLVDSLCHIASSLSSLTETEVRTRLSALSSYFDDVPAADVVLALAASEQLFTIKEWLDIQLATTAPEIVLDDEITWPIQGVIDVCAKCLC